MDQRYDTTPGSPDGPPVEDELAEKIGSAAGMVIGSLALLSFSILCLVAMVWGTFWMIVNFPT